MRRQALGPSARPIEEKLSLEQRQELARESEALVENARAMARGVSTRPPPSTLDIDSFRKRRECSRRSSSLTFSTQLFAYGHHRRGPDGCPRHGYVALQVPENRRGALRDGDIPIRGEG